MASPHPFESAKDHEVRLTSKLVKDAYPASANVHFVQIDRLDPPKKDMIKYLAAEKEGLPTPSIPRIFYAYYYTNELDFNKALVNVTSGHIITKQQQPKGTVGPFLPDDMMEWEEHCINHPIVIDEIKKLKLPSNYKVRTDPWIYATDDANEKRPLVQFFMYVLAGNGHTESNHYSLPLKFSPVFEAFTKKYVRMDYLPGGFDATTVPTGPWQEVECCEYHPDLNGEVNQRIVKPLLISQPEGPSFTVKGNKVEWQGWEFRISTSSREGFVVYDGYFKGRQVFYRVSLSEMTVPYGDPRAPYHRKQAFDLGDCGFGVNGNRLALGCDCLGVIKYMDGFGIHSNGEPFIIPNTVCMHEQDDGLLYKHVNYRTNNATVARRRIFIVQTIATVANYEYIINLKFVSDGSIDIEARATGILSTMPIDENVKVPWGTIVAPNCMAAYHQHILSFRIDPAVDGHKNTVVYDDTKKLPKDKELNPFGIGFVSDRKFVEKPGYIEQSPFTNRSYKVINENVINPISKTPVGYKINLPARQMLLADETSFNTRRAKFATQQMWVTKYHDHELFAAGEFTNQSQKDTGLAEWTVRDENVRNEDCVVWATMGFTHIPRVEDFPVMPVEIHNIMLTPFNFFNKNPALDIPQADNNFNKSILVESKEDGACCKTKI
ncbi:AMO2 [Candida pseudojiufengensis]|uniref:AMO2 n=1 Tax=Candida pseudojiufengensis TaxID=497109 RepID=UPI0022247FD4|nr:AMO2 [Candida pseudojiufengensis]KAI5966172.1 AMO2 [Candida pseudojiufengensis]